MTDASTVRFFNQIAPDWERIQKQMYSARVRDRILELAKVGPADQVLDMGAGAGFLSLALVARGARTTAADSSPAMLAELSRRAADLGELTTHLVTSGSSGLPDCSFDAVVANMYLHHVEDPVKAIADAARLLRPAGRLVIGDLSKHSFSSLQADHHDRWLGFAPRDLAAWFGDAGLHDVRVETTAEDCRSCSSDGAAVAIPILVASGVRPSP